MRSRLWAWLAMIPSAIIAGALVPILLTSAALPSNSWIGLRNGNAVDGVLATCSLGAAGGTNSVWSAVTGWHSLDIIQIGAQHTPTGDRYFAAWGSGEPGSGSYTERDLGVSGSGAHKYTVQLVSGSWRVSIDGRTQATIPTPTWAQTAVQVQNEVTTSERMGGSLASPVSCTGARVHQGTQWWVASWMQTRNGYSSSAKATFTADGFKVWR